MGFFGFNDESDEIVDFTSKKLTDAEQKANLERANRTDHLLKMTWQACLDKCGLVGDKAFNVALLLADGGVVNTHKSIVHIAELLYVYAEKHGKNYADCLTAYCAFNNLLLEQNKQTATIRDFACAEKIGFEKAVQVVTVASACAILEFGIFNRLREQTKGDTAFALYKLAQGFTSRDYRQTYEVFGKLTDLKVWQIRQLLDLCKQYNTLNRRMSDFL